MELFEAIEKRRTIRDFENEAIPAQVIEKIIGAGLQAPTNDHMRDWHYIVIQDKEVVAKLLDIIPKGISEEDMEQLLKDWSLSDSEQQSAYRNAVPKQHKMLMDAAAVIIPLLKQKTDILRPENISHLISGAVSRIFFWLRRRRAMAARCVCRWATKAAMQGRFWASPRIILCRAL